MPRKSKRLRDYNNAPVDLVDEKEFNLAVSNDTVHFICKDCNTRVASKKRLIVARMLKNNELLCDSCKNKRNRGV